ncbi:hypothetical protein CHAD_09805 [Corynebacterium hadale]|nr:hypothetical protein CHAD_09805 [Corynebacterium hadale]
MTATLSAGIVALATLITSATLDLLRVAGIIHLEGEDK